MKKNNKKEEIPNDNIPLEEFINNLAQSYENADLWEDEPEESLYEDVDNFIKRVNRNRLQP